MRGVVMGGAAGLSIEEDVRVHCAFKVRVPPDQVGALLDDGALQIYRLSSQVSGSKTGARACLHAYVLCVHICAWPGQRTLDGPVSIFSLEETPESAS